MWPDWCGFLVLTDLGGYRRLQGICERERVVTCRLAAFASSLDWGYLKMLSLEPKHTKIYKIHQKFF
jgi:hypothetical protein